MMLHEIPQGSKIWIEVGKSPENPSGIELFIFHHTDGMYSYCTSVADKERVVHLSVMTPLRKIEGEFDTFYEIDK